MQFYLAEVDGKVSNCNTRQAATGLSAIPEPHTGNSRPETRNTEPKTQNLQTLPPNSRTWNPETGPPADLSACSRQP